MRILIYASKAEPQSKNTIKQRSVSQLSRIGV
jgi:hypothetical protein